jgi:hypothetical protein
MLRGVTDSSLLFFQQLAPFYMVTVCKMLCLDTGILHLCSAVHNTGILHLCSAVHNTGFLTVPSDSLQ